MSYRKFFKIAFALIISRFPIDPMNVNCGSGLNFKHSFSTGHRETMKCFNNVVEHKRNTVLVIWEGSFLLDFCQ